MPDLALFQNKAPAVSYWLNKFEQVLYPASVTLPVSWDK